MSFNLFMLVSRLARATHISMLTNSKTKENLHFSAAAKLREIDCLFHRVNEKRPQKVCQTINYYLNYAITHRLLCLLFRRTQPQKTACQAMTEKRCRWTRGKVLGGSSVLNTMLYIRGNKRDYDLWEALGNEGWSHKDVLPYFIKSEDQRNPYLAKDTKNHGTGNISL